jgi:hypothetical protein
VPFDVMFTVLPAPVNVVTILFPASRATTLVLNDNVAVWGPIAPPPACSTVKWVKPPPDAVAVNVNGLPASDPDVAVTVYDPILSPSVSVLLACPLTFVVVAVVLSTCPPAPEGVVAIANVTPVPVTGFPPASVTVTTNGAASAVLICPFWLFPDVRLIVAAGPVVAVAVNVTGLPASDPEVAVTVYDPTLFPSVSVLLA